MTRGGMTRGGCSHLVRLALLVTFLAGCGPPAAPATLPALEPLATTLGVHTRLTDEAEPAKIERTLEMVRAMGAGWVVEYFPWAYHEPRRGRYEWEHIDQVLSGCEQNGLRLIARIDMVPAWARPPESTPKLLPPEHVDDYVEFVRQFARRYAGRVAGVVIWNEPNLSFEWGFRPVSAEEYADLLRRAYLAVKEEDPGMRVIAAGLAPTLEESDQALSELVYLRQLYAAGAAPYFDALAGHAYGWQEPPDEPPDPATINFRRLELQREIMVEAGDGAKPILVTETGWNDHPRWTKAVRPAQRIAYTLEALDLAANRWRWAEVVALWAFRLPTLAHNYNDYYTLVSPDFEPKPIYEALRARFGERPAEATDGLEPRSEP
jgi:polysaccharide biosynthesis protein PslG